MNGENVVSVRRKADCRVADHRLAIAAVRLFIFWLKVDGNFVGLDLTIDHAQPPEL